MIKIGLILSLALLASPAYSQETRVCVNEAIKETRKKISEHYAQNNIVASLPYINDIQLSSVISNGVAHKGAEYESVEYTTYTITGTMRIDGEKIHDYAFYVRINPVNCDVLKVALLKTGKSIYMVFTPTNSRQDLGGGLAGQTGTLSEVETPLKGSPKVGYTYAAKGEVSIPALNPRTLPYYIENAEKLIQLHQ